MNTQGKKLQYRYPGVTPFTTDQSHIFFGRERDTDHLLKMIMREPLTVLYGKSGLGKSSIINAGIIPAIEKANEYSPIIIRFGVQTKAEKASPIEITKKLLQKDHEPKTFLSRLITEDNSLWYHAKNRQLNGGGRPLLLFDQFEELFSYSDADRVAFQQEILELIHTDIPLRFRRKLEENDILSEEEEDRLETPLEARILFTIRSDRLHLLDRLKDYLPNILRNTYELKALAPEDAKMAITIPAQMKGDFHTPPFRFSEPALEKLLTFLKDKENQRIEAILIQMLCEHYEREYVEKSGIQLLDLRQIENPDKVISNYYEEKIHSLAPEDRLAVRRLIEESLISEVEGLRLSLHEAFIFQEYQIGKELLEKLVDSRLLRSEPFLRGGYTYELAHDRLTPAVMKARTSRREAEAVEEREKEALRLKRQTEQERLAKEKAKRQLRTVRGLLGFAIIAFILAAVGLLYALNQRDIIREKEAEATRLLKENIHKDSLNRIEKFNRFLAEAQTLQAKGEFLKAIDKYEFAKEFSPDTSELNLYIEDCRKAIGNLSKFEELMQKAKSRIRAGNYAEAITIYEETISLNVNPTKVSNALNDLKTDLNTLKIKENKAVEVYLPFNTEEAEKRRANVNQLERYILRIENLLNQL